jgi:hypothetical protein
MIKLSSKRIIHPIPSKIPDHMYIRYCIRHLIYCNTSSSLQGRGLLSLRCILTVSLLITQNNNDSNKG